MFFINEIARDFGLNDKTLTLREVENAARSLGAEVASIKAVIGVESRGRGFIDDQPIILFERHIFYRQLAHVPGVDRDEIAAEQPDICNPHWGGYGKTSEQHDRLDRAAQINRVAALQSASWGLFQIMGFHAGRLGYAGVIGFVERMCMSEGEQLQAFVRFVQADTDLHMTLRNRNWPRFARIYNGPEYERNRYDTRLAAAYGQHQTH